MDALKGKILLTWMIWGYRYDSGNLHMAPQFWFAALFFHWVKYNYWMFCEYIMMYLCTTKGHVIKPSIEVSKFGPVDLTSDLGAQNGISMYIYIYILILYQYRYDYTFIGMV